MEKKLIDLSASDLLEKFGAGEHKPGSGSAAAYLGILSSQLIRTVISLTKDPKRGTTYAASLPDLLVIEEELERDVLPRLKELFQEDSEIFDQVISLRRNRDLAKEIREVRRFEREALEFQILATEIPIEIARLCLRLAHFAITVFDSGFKSARGDSGVAINTALSSVAGCLSIIELNLLSFTDDEWTRRVREARHVISVELNELQRQASERLEDQRNQVEERARFYADLGEIEELAAGGTSLALDEIEDVATRLQRFVWINREKIWPGSDVASPEKVLNPDVVLRKCFGYRVEKTATLGTFSFQEGHVEVAGQIDQVEKIVTISEQFPRETQNFTMAHELGHSLFHEQAILHRDRPIDGGDSPRAHIREEWQADKFATFFLMPRKLVKIRFRKMFLTEELSLTQEIASALNFGTVDELRRKVRDERGFSRFIATCKYFNGKHFNSLAEQFHVSSEALAIRLEELELVRFR